MYNIMWYIIISALFSPSCQPAPPLRHTSDAILALPVIQRYYDSLESSRAVDQLHQPDINIFCNTVDIYIYCWDLGWLRIDRRYLNKAEPWLTPLSASLTSARSWWRGRRLCQTKVEEDNCQIRIIRNLGSQDKDCSTKCLEIGLYENVRHGFK